MASAFIGRNALFPQLPQFCFGNLLLFSLTGQCRQSVLFLGRRDAQFLWPFCSTCSDRLENSCNTRSGTPASSHPFAVRSILKPMSASFRANRA